MNDKLKKRYTVTILERTFSGKPAYSKETVEIEANSKAEALRIADKKYGAESVVASSVKQHHKCQFCPCVFETETDLEKHMRTFGRNRENHYRKWKRSHYDLERP